MLQRPISLGALVAVAAFALAVTRVEDADAWTHLALGRLMVEARTLPVQEFLVFPSGALPYHNTERLYDVVLYLAFPPGGRGSAPTPGRNRGCTTSSPRRGW